MTKEEISSYSRQAVENMLAKYGPNLKFSFDQIWDYLPDGIEIPSTRRPAQAKNLQRSGYIEKTGEMTNAASEKRAGSITPEYRFGSALLSHSEKGPAVSHGAGQLLDELRIAMESEGYIISTAELANFYLAMAASPLVILSGISGTGKTKLPRLFSKYTNSFFYSIPVQPQWSDNSDLLGYVPALDSSRFTEGHLIPSLRTATENPQKLTIVLLDEMNLAPVEYYLSDLISVAETLRRENDSITSDRLPLSLPAIITEGLDPWKNLRTITLPPNLRVVGTANMDETTRLFSPKVLDRAFTIEFDDPDLTAFATTSSPRSLRCSSLCTPLVDPGRPISINEVRQDCQELFEYVAGILSDVQGILAPSGIKFGYRTRDAILMYLYFWQKLELEEIISDNAAIDFCILQKILPKISGVGGALGRALESLIAWLGSRRTSLTDQFGFEGPFIRSLGKAERMKLLLDSDGATHYWGV